MHFSPNPLRARVLVIVFAFVIPHFHSSLVVFVIPERRLAGSLLFSLLVFLFFSSLFYFPFQLCNLYSFFQHPFMHS